MLDNMKFEINNSKFSKLEICNLLSISEITLDSWILEKRFIPASKLFLMSKIFGCSSDYLLNQKTERFY